MDDNLLDALRIDQLVRAAAHSAAANSASTDEWRFDWPTPAAAATAEAACATALRALSKLSLVFANIAAHPTDPKFRRLKIASPTMQQLVADAPGALRYLTVAAGFRPEGGPSATAPRQQQGQQLLVLSLDASWDPLRQARAAVGLAEVVLRRVGSSAEAEGLRVALEAHKAALAKEEAARLRLLRGEVPPRRTEQGGQAHGTIPMPAGHPAAVVGEPPALLPVTTALVEGALATPVGGAEAGGEEALLVGSMPFPDWDAAFRWLDTLSDDELGDWATAQNETTGGIGGSHSSSASVGSSAETVGRRVAAALGRCLRTGVGQAAVAAALRDQRGAAMRELLRGCHQRRFEHAQERTRAKGGGVKLRPPPALTVAAGTAPSPDEGIPAELMLTATRLVNDVAGLMELCWLLEGGVGYIAQHRIAAKELMAEFKRSRGSGIDKLHAAKAVWEEKLRALKSEKGAFAVAAVMMPPKARLGADDEDSDDAS